MFDAIVVGSGISGGWVAKELTEKGLKVLVLERGPNIVHGEGYKDGLMPWEHENGGRVPEDEVQRDYSDPEHDLSVQQRQQGRSGSTTASTPIRPPKARRSPGSGASTSVAAR